MNGPIRLALYAAGLVASAGLGAWGMSYLGSHPAVVKSGDAPLDIHDHAQGHDEHEGHDGHEEHAEGVVLMPPAKQESAGIEVRPAQKGDLVLSKWVTGKVSPNEDRLAHIYSLVEGTVHEVHVGYGDRVNGR